jgi:hypothetical protein
MVEQTRARFPPTISPSAFPPASGTIPEAESPSTPRGSVEVIASRKLSLVRAFAPLEENSTVAMGPWKVTKFPRCPKTVWKTVMSLYPTKGLGFAATRPMSRDGSRRPDPFPPRRHMIPRIEGSEKAQ